jgi:hypothetical protein
VTDEQIVDGFKVLREFFEFSLSRLYETLLRQLASLDHRVMDRLGEIEERLERLESATDAEP